MMVCECEYNTLWSSPPPPPPLLLVNRSMEAIQSSATQVRLEPHSEIAKRNAVFYRQQEGVTRKDFVPREVRASCSISCCLRVK